MDTYGVIGWPIKHSLSPAMHNAAFKALGIDAEYKLFEVRPEELEDFILNKKEVAGFNITIPHKIKAKEIIDNNFSVPVSKDARLIGSDLYYVELTGAINTVKRNNGNLEYWNTDAPGFLRALKEDLKFDAKNKNALLIGCGGAGRAIIAALSWKNINLNKLYVYELNRSQVDAAKKYFLTLSEEWRDILEKKIEYISLEQLPEKIKECQLLVNASPVGMEKENSSPIDKKFLHKDLYVYDVVYNRETQLVKDARALFGKEHAVDGRGMLAAQGAFSFSLWINGVKPADVVGVMRKELDKALL
ncbi:MAG: shikimate dehydrogenase [Candidatus Omnitrophota bacterium]|nr:shikimate dehydrogenase [Candidatus Omnitrophota bacterium]